MIVIDVYKTAAILKLSALGELYIMDQRAAYDVPLKVTVSGISDGFICLKIEDQKHLTIYSIEQFKGRWPQFLFMADNVWRDVFEDLY